MIRRDVVINGKALENGTRKTSEYFDILKTILGDSFKSTVPSTSFILKLLLIHLAALLWLAFNWICVVDLFLKGGSIFGVILSLALSGALSYCIVVHLGRMIEEDEEDFYSDVLEGGEWEQIIVEKE